MRISEFEWIEELNNVDRQIREAISDITDIIGNRQWPDQVACKPLWRIMEDVEILGRRLGSLAITMKMRDREERNERSD